MKKHLYIVVLFFLLSCDSKVNYQAPEDLIPRNQMIELLYDMHLALGTSKVENIHSEKDRNYMSLVLEKHNIDSVRFASSNLYYVSKAQEYEEIFEEVERRLDEIKSAYAKEIDSLIKEGRSAEAAYKLLDSLKEIQQVNY